MRTWLTYWLANISDAVRYLLGDDGTILPPPRKLEIVPWEPSKLTGAWGEVYPQFTPSWMNPDGSWEDALMHLHRKTRQQLVQRTVEARYVTHYERAERERDRMRAIQAAFARYTADHLAEVWNGPPREGGVPVGLVKMSLTLAPEKKPGGVV